MAPPSAGWRAEFGRIWLVIRHSSTDHPALERRSPVLRHSSTGHRAAGCGLRAVRVRARGGGTIRCRSLRGTRWSSPRGDVRSGVRGRVPRVVVGLASRHAPGSRPARRGAQVPPGVAGPRLPLP
ncbi:hypothetical protein BF93_09065 [Brachybacterium phenoliresistens]|uniref:Uncharacterized protein n=1 Tax=Brachybacterium phenoliresistens TaxID=396014 RepID=Z9JPV1_9MICO|nr:hypothetical protein BF93_09065 [Brachybacterium phenoliresistens]